MNSTFKVLCNSLIILALSMLQADAQTVSTPVVGFNRISFPAGNSPQTATFIKPNIFTGSATSTSSNSLTVASASFGSFGPSASFPTHYVKITSGPLSGYVFDILSNTLTTITVDGSVSTAGASPSFVVRPHVKASELFAGNTNLAAARDTLSLFNADGSTTVLLWVGSGGSSTGWVDPQTEEAADGVVYPGQGFLLTTLNSGSFTFQGVVETSPTVVPMYPGAINLVSRANPGSSLVSLQGIGLGSSMTTGLDTVEFWSSDGNLNSTAVYLWAGLDSGGFVDAQTEEPASANIAAAQVMNVTVRAPAAWSVAPPLNP